MSERRTLAWTAPYAGLDDDALRALGSAGLLRRARKDTVTELAHDEQGAVLDVSGATVRVDHRGPAAASCDCPTAGVCQHVLTACLWAVEVAPEAGAEPEPESGPDSPPEPEPGLNSPSEPEPGSPAQPRIVPQALPRAGRGSRVATSRATSATRSASGAVLKRRREALTDVRDVVGRLVSGGLSHLGPDDAEPLRALAGRVRLAGFEHVAGDQVGVVRLDGLLRGAAGLVAGLAGRDDAVTESDLLGAFAEVWAMCEVLHRALAADAPKAGRRPEPVGGHPPEAHADTRGGTAGRDEVDLARWVPLGARWWTAQSGSRGLAYLGWDAGPAVSSEHVVGQVRQVVTGRPSGADPRFQRSWTSPLLWGRSLSSLSEGAFSLTAVRIKPDGSLGAGGSPAIRSLRGDTVGDGFDGDGFDGDGFDGDGFDLEELRAIAERTGAGVVPRDVVGFGRRPANVQLVLVRDVGDVGIDEVRQEMTLAVVTSDGGTRMLRLPVTDEQAVETLLSVRSKLVAVTIERREDRDEPVGLFVRDKRAIRLVSPTLTPAWTLEKGYWNLWQRRIRRLRAQAATARTVRSMPAPPSPARRVTLLLDDVLLAAAATGRPVLTTRQRSDVEQARVLARDLGLATLERTAAGLLLGELTPPTVLRAAFVVGCARAVAEVAA